MPTTQLNSVMNGMGGGTNQEERFAHDSLNLLNSYVS